MSITLCRSFKTLAEQTWKRLEKAHETGLHWSEETNTETILLKLHERHAHQVKIVSFNKRQEARNGADWEWWIGSSAAWIGMRVQAKRIKLPNEIFWGLQTYRTKSKKITQIEQMIKRARKDKLNPMYVFYVFLYGNSSINLNFFPTGCLVGHAQAIRSNGSYKLTDLTRVVRPWHELVCNCKNGAPGSSVAGRSYKVLEYSYSQISRDDQSAKGEGEGEGEGEGAELALFEPQANLPDYMELLNEEKLPFSSAFNKRVFEESKAGERRIGGLVLIKGDEGEGTS